MKLSDVGQKADTEKSPFDHSHGHGQGGIEVQNPWDQSRSSNSALHTSSQVMIPQRGPETGSVPSSSASSILRISGRSIRRHFDCRNQTTLPTLFSRITLSFKRPSCSARDQRKDSSVGILSC